MCELRPSLETKLKMEIVPFKIQCHFSFCVEVSVAAVMGAFVLFTGGNKNQHNRAKNARRLRLDLR